MQKEKTQKGTKNEIEEEDEPEQEIFKEIDKIQEMGINAADITKLKNSGFCTVKSLLMAPKKELLNIKGITDAKLEKMIDAATKLEDASFLSGSAYLQKRKRVLKITTGSSKLDQIIGGGVESMALTEVFGEYRTGKTQLCHTLCVTAQMGKKDKGGNGKVLFIDSEGTFRPERIAPIAERFGLDAEEVLDNIIYARAYTTEHQTQLLTKAASMMLEETFSIIIIDSIMSLFRVDFSGRGELADRQQQLGKMLSRLSKLGEQFNVAIFMCNQVMSDPGGSVMPGAAVYPKPIGGHILAHASTTRVFLRKGKGECRVAKVFDSPMMAESEAMFMIKDSGVHDAEE